MSIIEDVLTGGISDFDVSNIPEAPYTVMEEVEEEDDTTHTTHARVDPHVGMVFESEPATYSFYNDYARFVGFGIRRRFLKRSKLNNDLIGRTYVCSKEGNKHVTKGVENPRPNTRTACKAMLKAKRIKNGKWVLLKFIPDHNHDLEPQCSRFFCSQKMMNTPEKNLITTLRASGIAVPKIMKVTAMQSGGVRNLSFSDKDCRNFCEKEQRAALSAGDAHVVLEFFVKMQLSNPRFFYSLELDDTRTLRNVFWIDSKSRMAYAHFGDVITFDTTYLTNKYALKFAPFVGVNHHGQSTLLGCALLTDETIESFVWVFKTWLVAMEGRAPKAIITDQAASIKAAIKEVFPEARHRFCIWHIMKKVPEKLGSVCKAHPNFMYKFDKCIYDSLTIKEFEERWENLTVTYGLVKHDWLVSLYECRSQWVPVFLKDTFFAGMSSSQRSESVNSLFDGYVNQNTRLKDFAVQYNLALEKRYDDEAHADFQGRQGAPHLKTTSPFEAQMAPLYTLAMFKKFQDEILAIPSCKILQLRLNGDSEVHEVMELMVKKNGKKGTKNYDVTMDDGAEIKCNCRLFEFKGYLCRHAMVVLFAKGVYAIPQSYILKRWTRDAREMDIFDEGFKTLKENSREYLAMCFNDLCFECMKFAEKGFSSKEKYMVAKGILKEAFEKLSSMDNHVQRLKEGYPVETVMPNIIIRDPQASTSTRRQKRIKTGVEESNEKKTERKCSNCKKPGHTITKCPEPKTKSMKVNSLNIESEKYMEHVDVEGLCDKDMAGGH